MDRDDTDSVDIDEFISYLHKVTAVVNEATKAEPPRSGGGTQAAADEIEEPASSPATPAPEPEPTQSLATIQGGSTEPAVAEK